MADALAKTITTLPQQLRRSVTWDRGKELSDHARFTVDTGVKVYFADPKSPWQRGTNENTVSPGVRYLFVFRFPMIGIPPSVQRST
jgi:IS30 family transposase